VWRAAILLAEFFAEFHHDLVVEISAAEVSVGMVAHDVGFTLNKLSDSHGSFRVTEVNECDSSGILLIEVSLSEETIVEANGGAFVDDAEALEASDL